MAEEKRTKTDDGDITGKTGNEEDGKGGLQIKTTQVVAGGLAALTAGWLGATLGTYGTVLGAGLASVITTVGSALYQHSLERARDAAKDAAKAAKVVAAKIPRRPGERASVGTIPARPGWPDPEATQMVRSPGPDDATQVVRPVGDPDATRVVRLPADADATQVVRVPGTAGPSNGPNGTPDTAAGVEEPGTESWRDWLKKRWVRVAGVSLLGFALGMAAVTGVELLRGESLSGTEGTTVTDLWHPQPPAPRNHQQPDPQEVPPNQDNSGNQQQDSPNDGVPPQPPASRSQQPSQDNTPSNTPEPSKGVKPSQPSDPSGNPKPPTNNQPAPNYPGNGGSDSGSGTGSESGGTNARSGQGAQQGSVLDPEQGGSHPN
ncbi:hypothetical protein GCM10012275_13730 [Longimycelium tulufanense]|uniref:Uncharacterized protein n=1 Tax=Longimycelium tulufanense TaxID=907463 RepID=A0A8J3FTT8_9PSEU|nr:hypothetical protein [Longimycelium tulufanense]GGM43965.1 hypothetical protein GCM10012275_13730 [Longimycelium tulufanense]